MSIKKGLSLLLVIIFAFSMFNLNIFASGTYTINFTLDSDNTTYSVAGITTTDTNLDITIPSTYNGLPVRDINAKAFSGSTAIRSVNISNGLSRIFTGAFYGCTNLISINIPNSVTEIGATFAFSGEDGVFENCTNLTNVNLSNSISSIPKRTFYKCSSLKSIAIPTGVTAINEEVFYNCSNLTKLLLPTTIKSINRYAFDGCFNNPSFIYYSGSQTQWNSISIQRTQKTLLDKTTKYYNVTSPVITDIMGNKTEWTRNVTLTVNGAVDCDGLNDTAYSFSTTPNVYNWQISNSKTFTTNQTVYIYVQDKLGNITDCGTQIIDKIDNTAPTYTDMSNVTNNNTTTITINGASDSQSGLDMAYSFSTTPNVYNWQISNSKTFTTNQTVYIYVQDKLGNITDCGQQTVTPICNDLDIDEDGMVDMTLTPTVTYGIKVPASLSVNGASGKAYVAGRPNSNITLSAPTALNMTDIKGNILNTNVSMGSGNALTLNASPTTVNRVNSDIATTWSILPLIGSWNGIITYSVSQN